MNSTKQTVRTNEGGVVLVLALLIFFLALVLVADTIFVSLVEWEASKNADTDLRLEYAVEGGFEIAKAYLIDDAENAPEIDTLIEPWSNPDGINRTFDYEGGFRSSMERESAPKVRIFIEDEERKWPLPILTLGNDAQKDRRKEGLVNVLATFRKGTRFDLDAAQATTYADIIYNFLNRPEGDLSYGPTPRPPTKSGVLLHISDLVLIPGLPPEIVFQEVDKDSGDIAPGLIDVLTLWTDLVININTAPEAVLRGLFRRIETEASVGTDIFHHREESAAKFLEEEQRQNRNPRDPAGRHQRQEALAEAAQIGREVQTESGPFQDLEDLKKRVNTVIERIFNETRTMMTVQSKTFSIWVEAEYLGVRRTRHWVVRREGARFVIILSELVNYPRFNPQSGDERP